MASSVDVSPSLSANGDIWQKIDPEFQRIKIVEDGFRYLIQNGMSVIPDGILIEVTPAMLSELPGEFREARKKNLANRDTQLRSVAIGTRRCGKNFPGNVQEHPVTRETCLEWMGIRECDDGRYVRFINFLDKLPTRIRNHVILAGGAPLHYITRFGSLADFDLFITDSDNPENVLENLVEEFHEKLSVCYVFRTSHSVTLRTNLGVIQIVLRAYRHPAEVVLGFDLGASACCYVPATRKYFCTERSLRSIKTATLHVDIDRMSETYNQRLVKYAHKGFSIRIPTPITVRHFDDAHFFVSNFPNSPRSMLKTRAFINQSLAGLLAGLLLGAKAFRRLLNNQETDYSKLSEAGMQALVNRNYRNDKVGVKFIETEEDHIVTGYGFNPHAMKGFKLLFKLRDEYVQKPLKKKFEDLTFIRENPGRQFTASFHPVDMSWDKWVNTEFTPDMFEEKTVPAPSVSAPILLMPTKPCGCRFDVCCRCIPQLPMFVPPSPAQIPTITVPKFVGPLGCPAIPQLNKNPPPAFSAPIPIFPDFVSDFGIRLTSKDLAKLKLLLR